MVEKVMQHITGWMHRIRFGDSGAISLYQIIELYFLGIIKGTLATRASSIAFSFFMAMFPFLIFVLNLIPFFPVANIEDTFSSFFLSVAPTEAQDFLNGVLYDIQSKPRGGLLSSTFLLSIFFMGNGVNAIFGGFSESIHVSLSRHFIKQYVYAVGVGVLLGLIFLISISGYLFFELWVAKIFDFGFELNPLIRLLFFFGMAYLVSSILFYFGTHRGFSSFFSAGALATTFLFALTSFGFGVYLDNFAQYNQLYGSIGAILILMLYIWLNAIVLLLGFELNASIAKLKQSR
ncbi:MAG: YihY/virulence factor BrkB family protein [Bacteroidetes bacterium]|nr:YihY/virulence factor BrkB family protein [Bacteroidota bacterium]MDA0888198.1 YihY/virulence factor BrkB family protein [Bacteroidota bacterium]MDA1084320.1 YihY/virulence factor BrkB family protein [Bacteroidota bacterium]